MSSTIPVPALVAQGIEHRFPKPIWGALRTKAKRLKTLQGLRFDLSSSRIISHVFTPVAAQVRPKHDPELPQSRRAATTLRHGNLYIARVEYLGSGTVHQRGADLIHRKGGRCRQDGPRAVHAQTEPVQAGARDPLAVRPRRSGRRHRQAPAAQVGLVKSCPLGRARSALRHRSAGQMERELTGLGFTCTVEESDLCGRILVQLWLPGLP